MTAAPPMATPAQGVAVTPVVLALGTTSTVPFPPLPTAGSQPVPWRTPWLVILNSSPFTLKVTSGALTVQIAAYTSDKVMVFATGNPVTVTPQAGATLPVGGQDTTIYATWYASEPPGAYPAALGSGAALLAQQTTIVPLTNTVLPAGNSIGFPGGVGGVFSTLGFGGMTVALNETTGNGPVTLDITWADSVLTTVQTRRIICPAGGSAQFSVPHFAANVAFLITNFNGAVATTTNFEVIFTALALAAWNVKVGTENQSVLASRTGVVISAGANQVIGAGNVYAGPATLSIDLGGMPAYDVQVVRIPATGGVGTAFARWRTGAGSLNPFGDVKQLILPPVPVRVSVTNNSQGTYTYSYALVADDWRVG